MRTLLITPLTLTTLCVCVACTPPSPEDGNPASIGTAGTGGNDSAEPSVDGGAGGGTGGTGVAGGGAGIGGGGTGGATNPEPSTCRTYATAGTVVGNIAGPGTYACTLEDGYRVIYQCTFDTLHWGEWTYLWFYDSYESFVREAHAVGKFQFLASERNAPVPEYYFMLDLSYDPQHRPDTVTAGTASLTYSNWDTSGRATRGTMDWLGCEFPVKITYDEVARTRTDHYLPSQGSGTCDGADWTNMVKSDADGNLIDQRDWMDMSIEFRLTREVTATNEFCL